MTFFLSLHSVGNLHYIVLPRQGRRGKKTLETKEVFAITWHTNGEGVYNYEREEFVKLYLLSME